MLSITRDEVQVSGGGKLELRVSGEGSPVLLIHGTGGAAWFGSVAHLASRHRVVDYDRRGFGRSTPLGVRGYLDAQVADAIALIEKLGLQNGVVVGHSWGGIVALGLAIRAPELVGRLVLMEPPLHAKSSPTPDFLAAFLKVQVLRRFSGEEAAARAFLTFAMARKSRSNTFDRLPDDARTEILRNAAGTLVELDAGTGEELNDAEVSSIRHPVLILKGACTRAIFGKVTDRLASKLTHAQVRVLPEAGHMMQFDQPDEFEAAVLDVAG